MENLYKFDLSQNEIPIEDIIKNSYLNPVKQVGSGLKVSNINTIQKKCLSNLNIILIVILIFILLLYIINYFDLKKINNNYTILQKYKPNQKQIIDLIRERSPTIITGIVEDWFIYNENDTISKKKLTKEILNENTKILNLPLTLVKKYNVLDIDKGKKTKLIKEKNTHHLFVVLEGNLTFYLFNNDQKIEYDIVKNTCISKYQPFDNSLELKHTKYMEIKVYSEQIIYIPYGWWYCYKSNDDTLIIDINSENIFSLILRHF